MKFCCVTWETLVIELREAKLLELEKLKEKGIPASMLAPVVKVLDTMDDYCPVCGHSFNEEETVVKVTTPIRQVVAKPVQTQRKVTCPSCKGKKVLGKDKNNIDINCMTCWGKGYVTKANFVSDIKSQSEENSETRVQEKEEE